MNSILAARNIVRSVAKSDYFKAIVVLLIVLVLFYKDVVFEGKTFLMETAAPGTMPYAGPYNYHGTQPSFVVNDPGAIAWQNEPFNRFISKSIKQGDFPLWNPYAGLAGAPLLADGQTGPLEPIQFLFFLVPIRFWPYTMDWQLLIRFFIAGFGCYLFARRLKLGLWGSIAAGIMFMLCSYFVTFGDHAEIKAESLLPLVLYGYDRLAHTEDRRGFWYCGLLIGWLIVAAMPESTFFALFLGTLWYFYNSILLREQNEGVLNQAKRVVRRYLGSTLLGFLVSAAYLFPFLEFVHYGVSAHSPGGGSASFPLSVLPYLVFQVRDIRFLNVGFVALFSLSYSLLSLKDFSKYRTHTIFFISYALFNLSLVFDFAITGWIKRLPVFNQVVFYKYSIPSIVFCLAILTGFLIDSLRKTPLSYKRISLSLLIVFACFIALPTLENESRSLLAYFPDPRSMYIALGLIAAISAGLYFLAYLGQHRNSTTIVVQLGLLAMVLSEPFQWEAKIQRPDRVDPYQIPKFLEYLREDQQPFRIFGTDGILYPNISTAYKISDVRWLNALVIRRAYDFSVRFISPDETSGIRLTGTILPVSDQMFNLLNVKYVLQQNTIDQASYSCATTSVDQPLRNQPYFGVSTLDDLILQQNINDAGLQESRLSINGSTRTAINAPAPTRLKFDVSVPQTAERLNFSIGVNPQVFRPDRGDGVGFQVNVVEEGKRTEIFSNYINPKQDPCDRKWFDESIDMSPWAGKNVSIRLLTNGGPSNDISWDWAYWGDIHFTAPASGDNAAVTESTTHQNYSLVHQDPYVLIYQNNTVLPRAFVAYHAVNVTNSKDALNMISDPKLDPGQTAVVENLPVGSISSINQNAPTMQSMPATVKQVSSSQVNVDLNANASGLLVLSDQYYPGWGAFVDGMRSPIYAVDGTFRGVFLNKGSHTVTFLYQPLSFIVGAVISSLSLIAALIFLQLKSKSSTIK